MLKTNYLTRSICIMCACVALAAVSSCYDDTDLRNSVDDLTGRVESLEEFRDQVQSDITSLQDIIEKIQSAVTIDNVVDDGDGYTINFSDGTSITIKDGVDGEDGMTPPSITVVEEDGVYYWALENADGSVDFIEGPDGERIPVTGDAVAPQVRINPQTGNWEISTDGGQTWQDTGMPSTGGSGDSIFESVDQDDSYVYLTLRGGTVIILPKTTELSFSFGVEEEILYFAAGESKTLDYKMSGAATVVITKPDGWKASIESEGFVITAPVTENTFAETAGMISVILTAENGQSLVAEQEVMVGEPPVQEDVFSIEVPAEDITATSARVITTCSDMTISWYSGLMPQDEFDLYVVDKANMEDYFLEQVQNTADYYGYTVEELLYAGFLYEPGYGTDDYVWSGLTAETKHLTYAVGMDYEANYTTEFYWGPEFTTLEYQLSDLTFDINVTPQVTSAILDVYPSDKSAYFWTTVIDNSFYEAGYTDEEIMTEILDNAYFYILFYGQYYMGDTEGLNVTGMSPNTDYYAVAFGFDMDALVFNSEMAKEPFTTLESQPTDAYATASMDNYWSIDDLSAYNPDYAGLLQDPTNPVLAAVDFEYNEEATSCVYILWIGDLSSSDYDELYSATLGQGDNAYKGDPAPLFYVAFDSDPTTLCVIAVDANGNYGDMYTEVVTFPESGKSTDYALFDEYYNALMGGYSYAPKASAPAFSKRANYVEREVSQVVSVKKEAVDTKVLKVISNK